MKRLSLAAALVLAAASCAHAQSNKPVRSGTYYEDRASNSTGISALDLKFAQTPADKFLNITVVSCTFSYGNSQVLNDAYLFIGTTSGSADTGRSFNVRGGPVSITQSAGGVRTFLNSTGIYFKVGPGRYPSLHIETSGTIASLAGNCTIVGDLSDS